MTIARNLPPLNQVLRPTTLYSTDLCAYWPYAQSKFTRHVPQLNQPLRATPLRSTDLCALRLSAYSRFMRQVSPVNLTLRHSPQSTFARNAPLLTRPLRVTTLRIRKVRVHRPSAQSSFKLYPLLPTDLCALRISDYSRFMLQASHLNRPFA